MWLAIHAPQRLNRIVLANTAARIGSVELWNQRIATAQTVGMAALAFMSLERWYTSPYRDKHADEMEQFRAMIAATDVKGHEACCRVLRDTALRSEVASIGAPSLVISGTHDPATPPSDGGALHAALSDSRYVELDASHLSAWERADKFVSAVLTFLKNCDRKDRERTDG